MDGLNSGADVTFLLTTNRADLLEPALAARPGRVDLAAEPPHPKPDHPDPKPDHPRPKRPPKKPAPAP